MFRLMGDPSRLRIVLACLDAPICVSDVAARTRLSQSLVSHHLRLLRAARILRAERQGKQVFYARPTTTSGARLPTWWLMSVNKPIQRSRDHGQWRDDQDCRGGHLW
jgi:DNA-binding transcriptional ArsR family regulator